MADSDIGGRDELAAMIEGKSDDDINAAVAGRGTEKVLGQLFDAWAARFDPNRAGNQSAVIGFDITSPEGTHQYQLKVADGTCETVTGAPEAARVTLGLAVPDLLRLVTGKLDGMQAFMTGKLKLSGDMMFAQSMQSWFAS
jgi:putative sterol carrier protein